METGRTGGGKRFKATKADETKEAKLKAAGGRARSVAGGAARANRASKAKYKAKVVTESKIVHGAVSTPIPPDPKLTLSFEKYRLLMKDLKLDNKYSSLEKLALLSSKDREDFMEMVENLEFLAKSFAIYVDLLQGSLDYFPKYSTWEKVAVLSPEEQLAFLKIVEEMKTYQRQEAKSQGWGEWIRGGITRAIKFYKRGAESAEDVRHVASIGAEQAKIEAEELVRNVGNKIVETVNTAVSFSGNLTLGAASYIVPNVLGGLRIAEGAVLGGDVEEAMREAQQINEAAASAIASRKISETPVQDLTNAVQGALVGARG